MKEKHTMGMPHEPRGQDVLLVFVIFFLLLIMACFALYGFIVFFKIT